MRTIGILGGMGPEATILLMQRLIAAVPAGDDKDHVPLIVEQNPQVPSRIAHLIERTGEDPAPVLARMAIRLERAGCAALAMPCNTAHHYAQEIRTAVGIPLLDMITLCADRVAATLPHGGKVGILASPAVQRIGLFDKALGEHGLDALYPANGDTLLAAIRDIKARGPSRDAVATLRAAARALSEQGAQVNLVACSEFSLLKGIAPPGIRLIDTLDVLVEEIVAFARAGRTRAEDETPMTHNRETP